MVINAQWVRSICFLVTIVVFSVGPKANADELLSIRVPSDMPPFSYGKNNEIIGANVELVQELSSRLKREVIVSLIPWSRLIEGVWLSKSDAVMVGSVAFNSIPLGAGIMPSLLSSDTIFQSHVSAIVRLDSDFHPKQISDLEGLKVGVIQGWSYGEAVEAALGGKVRVVMRGEDMVRMLGIGVLDVALMEEMPMRYYQGLGDSNYQFTSSMRVFTYDIVLVFSRERLGEHADIFIDKINTIIGEMKSDGTVDRILGRYE